MLGFQDRLVALVGRVGGPPGAPRPQGVPKAACGPQLLVAVFTSI